MIVENLFRDHRPGNDLSGASHEELKKGIFFRGELDPVSFPEKPDVPPVSKMRLAICIAKAEGTALPLLKIAWILASNSLKENGLVR